MRARDLARYRRDLGWDGGWAEPAPSPPEPEPTARRERPAPAAAPPRAEAAPAPPAAGPDPASCATLEELAELCSTCTACPLARTRRTVVVGEGDPRAAVMLIGEAPGAEEDESGRPFVGQCGALLEAMLRSIGLTREQVFIANVVKCRPPRNRDPVDQEVAACARFLDRQIELVRPRVIVALGKHAARRLIGSTSIRAVRGRWTELRGIPLLPTLHPGALLREPIDKRLAWQDLKSLKKRLE